MKTKIHPPAIRLKQNLRCLQRIPVEGVEWRGHLQDGPGAVRGVHEDNGATSRSAVGSRSDSAASTLPVPHPICAPFPLLFGRCVPCGRVQSSGSWGGVRLLLSWALLGQGRACGLGFGVTLALSPGTPPPQMTSGSWEGAAELCLTTHRLLPGGGGCGRG